MDTETKVKKVKTYVTKAQMDAHPKYFKISKGIPVPQRAYLNKNREPTLTQELMAMLMTLEITTKDTKPEDIQSIPVDYEQLQTLQYPINRLLRAEKPAMFSTRIEKESLREPDKTKRLYRIWRVPFQEKRMETGQKIGKINKGKKKTG